MKVVSNKGRSEVIFEEDDERFLWQVVAGRLVQGSATLHNEFIKTMEEMARLAKQLSEDPVVRQRPNGERWTFRYGDDGQLRVEIEPPR